MHACMHARTYTHTHTPVCDRGHSINSAAKSSSCWILMQFFFRGSRSRNKLFIFDAGLIHRIKIRIQELTQFLPRWIGVVVRIWGNQLPWWSLRIPSASSCSCYYTGMRTYAATVSFHCLLFNQPIFPVLVCHHKGLPLQTVTVAISSII